MKTKLLIEINDLEQGQEFIKRKLGSIVLNIKGVTYTKQFNCYTNEISILAQLAKENDVELFVNLDMLYHEDDIIGLRAILKKLYKLDITGLIISDVGIIELVKELNLNFKFINGGAILNTNYASVKSTDALYDGYYLSNEINIDEILYIAQNTNTDLIVQVFGKQRIFNSKRQLLTSYYEYNDLKIIDFHPRNHLVISDTNEKDNHSYIYEDQFGTHVYTKNNVLGLKYIDKLMKNNVSYFYLNNLFCIANEYEDVVNIFYRFLSEENYTYESALEDLESVSKNFDESFFNDETFYTIEQAKLLEMELRNE